jgi:hypothetical protein
VIWTIKTHGFEHQILASLSLTETHSDSTLPREDIIESFHSCQATQSELLTQTAYHLQKRKYLPGGNPFLLYCSAWNTMWFVPISKEEAMEKF